jgi:predicted S18 family serine protease
MADKTNQKVEEFIKKIQDSKKDHKFDLSTEEDLSVAIMNLISIEEHFFFTAQKTGDNKYFDLLAEVREMRKSLMKKMIKDYEGEVWCISKHLLASSMRLMEVGTKLLGKGKKVEAKEMFGKAYDLYNLFWGLNLNVIETKNIQKIENDKLNKNDTQKNSVFAKLGVLVKKAVDCCIE